MKGKSRGWVERSKEMRGGRRRWRTDRGGVTRCQESGRTCWWWHRLVVEWRWPGMALVWQRGSRQIQGRLDSPHALWFTDTQNEMTNWQCRVRKYTMPFSIRVVCMSTSEITIIYEAVMVTQSLIIIYFGFSFHSEVKRLFLGLFLLHTVIRLAMYDW